MHLNLHNFWYRCGVSSGKNLGPNVFMPEHSGRSSRGWVWLFLRWVLAAPLCKAEPLSLLVTSNSFTPIQNHSHSLSPSSQLSGCSPWAPSALLWPSLFPFTLGSPMSLFSLGECTGGTCVSCPSSQSAGGGQIQDWGRACSCPLLWGRAGWRGDAPWGGRLRAFCRIGDPRVG